jgi:hypothetical protein
MRNRLYSLVLSILFLQSLSRILYAAEYDLDVGWISRSPRIPYIENPVNPRRDGWPKEGQIVKWEAHISNWGKTDARAVNYRFLLDGLTVQSGTVDIQGKGGKMIVRFPWAWEFQRHDLTFEIDSDNRFKELEEKNNRLVVQTDAVSVGFYVEKSVYDYFQQNQKLLQAGSNSWEDWAQRQISTLNAMYASAISPEAPHGVLDRWRIDEVRMVHDGALPIQGGTGPGRPFRDPNTTDHFPDIIWGFPSTVLDGVTYKDVTSKTPRNSFYIEGSLVHELNHVRYLIDVYLLQINNNSQTAMVQIQQDGHPVVGTSLMPVDRAGIVYKTFETGLMNQEYTYVDRYSAVALNLISGYRARGDLANTIYNSEFGIFLENIPKRNRIRFVNRDGTPISGAQVDLFKAERGKLVPGGPFGSQYEVIYGNTPDNSQQADQNGEVVFQGDPFRKPGECCFLTGVSILRVTSGNQASFVYFELTAANRAFWRGQHKEATYEFVIDINPCTQAAQNLKAIHKANQIVRFQWDKTPGAYGYVVWASIGATPWKVLGSAFDTNLEVPLKGGIIRWYVESDFDQCLRSNSVEKVLK